MTPVRIVHLGHGDRTRCGRVLHRTLLDRVAADDVRLCKTCTRCAGNFCAWWTLDNEGRIIDFSGRQAVTRAANAYVSVVLP